MSTVNNLNCLLIMTPKNDIQAQLESLWKTQQEIIQRLEKIEQRLSPPELPRLALPATDIHLPDPSPKQSLSVAKKLGRENGRKYLAILMLIVFSTLKSCPPAKFCFPKEGLKSSKADKM